MRHLLTKPRRMLNTPRAANPTMNVHFELKMSAIRPPVSRVEARTSAYLQGRQGVN